MTRSIGSQSRAEKLAGLGPERRRRLIAAMDAGTVSAVEHDWAFWARPAQIAPGDEDWRIWLVMAGRGFGKTRAGAEWVRSLAEADGGLRIALVGATMAEARAVMVEGESGLLAIAPMGVRPRFEPSLRRLSWPNGAQAMLYSAAEPEGLRGPQHHFAWADEIAKWAYGLETWDNLTMGLRLGERPRIVATTTPRPVPLLRRILRDTNGLRVTHGAMADNRANLPSAFVAAMEQEHRGTRVGRQELDGELIEEAKGALWTRGLIERQRAYAAPNVARVVLGVDPPGSAGGDACGIMAVALGRDGNAYVIEDASVSGVSPEGWARAVVTAAERHRAERIVAEANMGGDMVAAVLRAVSAALPLRLVHATRGKSARAEPVAALYESGRAWHVGGYPALEDEMCGILAAGGYQGPGRSPDRADALVWAMTELMLKPVGRPSIRQA